MAELERFFWFVWVAGLLLIFAYGFVLLYGAPYFPSLKPHIADAIKLLSLKKGQVVYDLGCGDGRFLKAAAKAGYKAVGYELNPFMFAYSWLTTRRYGRRVKVRFGNFWKADISKADAFYVFLLPKYMKQLDEKISTSAKKPNQLISHTFKIPGKKPTAKAGVMLLYKY